jgi:chorismate mutase
VSFKLENKRPTVIAGPCSAENREQVIATARELKSNENVKFFRAGLWKPRTRPNSFEGVGAEGMVWLSEVQTELNMPVMTEVANAEHAEIALKHGIDAVWIGARTTVSPFSVQNIADALKGTSMPVMVKNPMHADLGLWLGALERFAASTSGDVAALHRGFSNFTQHKYRNAPMWELPIGLKAELPEVSLFCDPSHICGNTELLSFVSQKAMDLGMDGLMLETHTLPEKALSDASQQITPLQLQQLIDGLEIRSSLKDSTSDRDLSALRIKMDSIDEQLMELLSGRMEIATLMGEFKKEEGLTVLHLERWREIVKTRMKWSAELGLSEEFILRVLEQVHKESIKVQTDVMNQDF